ncbi:MAG: hypothetical protein IPO45_11555 [Saprospiraceae bacterium]|uniref:hypothetical protein n=1 Tax=Candidatus Brachybacter algidus TaxID=2982024 RepID=UPI001B4D4D85|nr:hypothetical protein [Candidatus Brachybacter algidus]MBP7305043.1 hypothetical protein [Saprospiraceae bacterium]MBK6373142.1 hypothetical protein [Candidatus Brachybacter algidus]MBK8354734.1 hypothetical protein [Candidatus Brachybacter algidus]MBK8843694.1 hypothetical protein [Candidatus Brachybacter algidus]MBK9024879.1 hypothetical protein [Candidatus Brachybacter algidus]
MSELFMPADIGEENDEINMDIILSKLNMGNIFDMDIKHKNNDILELVFSFKADRERFRNFSPNTGDFLAYAFKYRNGQWKKFDYENWVINFDEVEKGKIVNPFKSKKN